MSGDDEILIEMARIGGALEVRAIATHDGLEVVFVAPANAARSDIQQLARAKLAYVRRKKQGGEPSADDKPQKPDGKGGWVA